MQATACRAASGCAAGPSRQQRNALCGASLPRQRHTVAASVAAGLRVRARATTLSVQARYSGGGAARSSSGPDIVERVLAAVPYILPFFDAISYGRYILHAYPAVRAAIQPILPAMGLYHSVPFGGFIAFFALYLGVVNNNSLSRFVRFNASQAILLDVLLALPRLVETVLAPPSFGWGQQAYVLSQNFIWIFISLWVAFGIVNSLLGQYTRIPFVGDAAEQQLR